MLDSALWSGNAHPALAKRMASYLGCPLWPVPVQSFADGETAIQIPHPLKTRSLVIAQSLCAPVNHHLMELLLMVDAAHQTGCKSISIVIPYCAYARQDRHNPDFYTPLAAKLVADLLGTRNIDRIITLDLHSALSETFFSMPLTHVYSTTLLAENIQQKNPLIVSPDLGGSERAQRLAFTLKTDYIVLDKKVLKNNTLHTIKNRPCIIVDDIVDSGKTLCNATHLLKKQGAYSVFAYATHAVLSNHALENLLHSDIDKILLTDTLPLSLLNQQYLNNNPTKASKLNILSVTPLLTKAIKKNL